MISKLSDFLAEKNIDIFLVPSTDEFLSEYAALHSQRLKFISNFTGSNGLLLVRKAPYNSVFFTDGRYINQAKIELDKNIDIFNMRDVDYSEFIVQKFEAGNIVSYDPRLHSYGSISKLQNKLEKHKFILRPIENPIDQIWNDRPALPSRHPFIMLGQQIDINTNDCDYYIITNPESICYALGIRGYDLPNNLVVLGYLVIDQKGNKTLFTYNKERFDEEYDFSVREFKDFSSFLETYCVNKKIIYDQFHSNAWLYQHLKSVNANIIHAEDPILLKRAIKSEQEIKNFQQSHIYDAVAVIKSIYEIKNNFDNSIPQTEMDIDNILLKHRSASNEFIIPSFPSIVGFKENGAIIHYRANENTNKLIDEGILLIDSGGHYYSGGTTDITRTIALSNKIQAKWKLLYTLVLKGHLNLARAKFPPNTKGFQLDSLARQFLWQHGYNYDHGTGHGVGTALNVHEGPHSISPYPNNQILHAGMIVSNEPGVYLTGEFGIRIENLMYIVENNEGFMEFKNLTLVPYEKSLIDFDLLDITEINQIKQYYSEIKSIILPIIDDHDTELWLKENLNIEDKL